MPMTLEEYAQHFSKYFRRVDGVILAQSYMKGLIMDGERKSVEPISEKLNVSERGLQRLLTATVIKVK